MTEKEYTLSADLQKLRIVQQTLSEITPENNEIIDRDEYGNIMRILYRWLNKHFNELKVNP